MLPEPQGDSTCHQSGQLSFAIFSRFCMFVSVEAASEADDAPMWDWRHHEDRLCSRRVSGT
jgi:hypothetical protein